MDIQTVIDLGRNAVLSSLLLASPMLLVGMIVGLLIGLLQAVTQVQDQTVSFVPKILAMVMAFSFALPWLIIKALEYTGELYATIPTRL